MATLPDGFYQFIRSLWLNRILASLLAGFFCLAGCSTEVEVNAPYRERAVIYALINTMDSLHYVRIQRSFLTIEEPDAYKAAKVKDSIYYTGNDVLDVRMFLDIPGQAPRLLGVLERLDTAMKDSGIFYASDQFVYRLKARLLLEDSSRTAMILKRNRPMIANRHIRLVVSNRKTGYQTSARTKLVYPLYDLENEQEKVSNYYMRLPIRYKAERTLATIKPEISIGVPLNAEMMSIIMHIPYRQQYQDGHWDTLEAHWNFCPRTYVGPWIPFLTMAYKSPTDDLDFFEALLNQVDTSRILLRKLLPLRIEVLASDSIYAQYYQVQRRMSLITQTKPVISNFDNGLGLLSTRYRRVFYAKADSVSTYGILLRD